ncbi:MAG TPA: D-2-hydroxyacid dehydrogenase family protein [Acidimicrobiia bacterium]|nr:D-2-hydroxyacid dehydrogenase family protein [Acidimicrobiia bacterium]
MRVAVLDDYQEIAASYADWGNLAAEVTFFPDHLADDEALIARLVGFDVIVAMRERTPFQRPLLALLPNLRLLVTTGMRNASIDVKAATDLGINVSGTNSPGVATAELAFGMVLALSRNLILEAGSVAEGGWQKRIGRDLRSSTLGVVGLGKLGAKVARYGSAFGMDVIAWSQNLLPERAEEVGARLVDKETLLAESDFVSIHLRLSDRTRGLIGEADLDKMKPTAYLINTSRGEIVDTAALLAALDSGALAGAGIDVFDVEPLPPDDRLRTHHKILATPHIGYVTDATYRVFYSEAVEDIAAWQAGTPIRVLTT